MSAVYAAILVFILFLIPAIGVGALHLDTLFGVVIPYMALLVFVGGVIFRVYKWAKAPVPFRIPTTCGQQKSHDWIKRNRFDNPSDTLGVIGRMAAEVFLFRSLFRNTAVEKVDDRHITFGSAKLLWIAGLAFHYTFLTILIRHLRFFIGEVPFVVKLAEHLDGFFQIATPVFYMTSLIFLGALTVLLLRRILVPQVRYISLLQDYFPLMLIIGIALTGVLMRYFVKVDIVTVKEITHGLATFSPTKPANPVGWIFYAHLFMVASLAVYFPFSKLTHMAGVFMSPTRNLANNNRAVRHENPWDYPVKVHTYAEYEDEFRERMVKVGLPVDKPLEQKDKE